MGARKVFVSVAVTAVTAVTLAGTAGTATEAAAAPPPVKLALVTSLTGEAAPEYATTALGFDARIALQNAEGGVDGRKIEGIVINDQTNPATAATAVQDAVSKGVAGIVAESPLFFLGAKYAQQAGLPVTGGFFDGPEWGEQPYTNMFAADAGSVDPKYPVSTLFGGILKKFGATVVGSYGYGISPTSARGAAGAADSAQHLGLRVGVLDTSVPFGSVTFGAAALVARSKGVNGIFGAMDGDSNFALLTALKQAGVKVKVPLFPTGYDPSIIGTPTWQEVQGAYFVSEFRPYALPDAGTRQMAAALQKYEHRPPSQFPTYNIYESWLGADLMIKGLERAGRDASSSQVIKALRGITHYTGDGLLATPIDFKTVFGHDLSPYCVWVLRAEKKGFVLTSKDTYCGTDVPGTSTASSG